MRNRTQYLILTALFTALTAVGAFIKIPVGPAPISLQLFFIVLAGVLLGPWYGCLSQILYVGLGLVGVPIFTSGGGFSYIFNPSFGYLLGFILVPIIVGLLTRKFGSSKFLPIFLTACAGATMLLSAVLLLFGQPVDQLGWGTLYGPLASGASGSFLAIVIWLVLAGAGMGLQIARNKSFEVDMARYETQRISGAM